MRFSFIIPAKNEERLIDKCLTSIEYSCVSCRLKEDDYEIIVVNNLSTDRTYLICSTHNVNIVLSDAKSIAGVRNKGTEFATGDYFIFVDADSQINTNLLRKVIWEIEDRPCIGGGCKLSITNGTWISNFICDSWNSLCKKNKWFTGSFIFVERRAFIQISAFNNKLFLCEDIAFSKMLNWFAEINNKKTVYIEDESISTSDRKLKLFSVWEHITFWIDCLLHFKKVIITRERCNIWYDIRR